MSNYPNMDLSEALAPWNEVEMEYECIYCDALVKEHKGVCLSCQQAINDHESEERDALIRATINQEAA